MIFLNSQNVSKCDTLSPKLQMAVTLMASGLNITEAAQKVKMSRQSLSRVMKRDDVREELEKQREFMRLHLADSVKGILVKAAKTLYAVFNNPDVPPTERGRLAAQVIARVISPISLISSEKNALDRERSALLDFMSGIEDNKESE